MRAVAAREHHARIGKKIINFDSGGYGVCAWDECDNDANSLFQVRTHEHPPAARCDDVDALGGTGGRHVWYAFCRERHKQYWLNASGARANESLARTGRAYGNLPAGMRGGIL